MKSSKLFKNRLVIPAKAGIYNQTGVVWLVCRILTGLIMDLRIRGDDGLSEVLAFEQP